MFVRALAGVALLFVASPAFGGELRNNEMIIGGGSCDSDGMWVSGPSLYLRRDTPAIAAGMVRPPGKARAYAYILVIKGDKQRKTLARYDGQSSASGTSASRGATATSRGSVEIGNRKVAFAYHLRVDPAGRLPPVESLCIDGNPVDLEKGRVVLVDLSPDGGKLKQVRVGLPESPSWPTEADQVESQAKNLLKNLRRRSEAVREFLK
jgi:hypothetical protein